MVYTDGEIYRKIKEGVEIKILAQLNACSTEVIIQAYERYGDYIQKANTARYSYEDWERAKQEGNWSEYRRMMRKEENIMKNEVKVAKAPLKEQPKEKTPKYKKKNPFVYDEMTLNAMRIQLGAGITTRELYNKLFGGLNVAKPNYDSFVNRCSKIRKELGIAKTMTKKPPVKKGKTTTNKTDKDLHKSSNKVETDSGKDLRRLMQYKRELMEKDIIRLQKELQDKIYELAEFDIVLKHMK